MEKISGIYSITNKINGKVYYGSSVNINKRWKKHKLCLRKNTHDNCYLQNAWNKNGEENFEFKVVATCPEEYLLKLEQHFLNSNFKDGKELGN